LRDVVDFENLNKPWEEMIAELPSVFPVSRRNLAMLAPAVRSNPPEN
jgi:hypothetical protein